MIVDDVKILDLINRGIDGELSPRQAARLDRLRAERPEVDAYYRQTAEVADRIRSLDAANPPAYLKTRILRSLPQRAAPARQSHQSVVAGLIERFRLVTQPQLALQLASVFIIGLLVGGLFMTIGPLSGAVDPSDVVGTMGAERSTASLEGAHFQGTVGLARTDDRVTITIRGTTDQPAEVQIAVSPERILWTGYSNQAPQLPGQSPIEIAGTAEGVTLTLTGQNIVALDFDVAGASALAENAEFVITLKEKGTDVASRKLSI